MEQLVKVVNSKGRIGVNESEFSCALLVDEKFVGAFWPDCEGSIGQCIWLPEIELDSCLSSWETIINFGHFQEGSLAETFEPVINTLITGTYTLTFYDQDFEWEIIDPSNRNRRSFGYYEEIYPWELQLISTIPRSRIDFERVQYFENIIKNHGLPEAITISNQNNWCSYILDGHHKLEAYRRLKKTPSILSIECVSSSTDINLVEVIKNETVLREFKRRSRIYDDFP